MQSVRPIEIQIRVWQFAVIGRRVKRVRGRYQYSRARTGQTSSLTSFGALLNCGALVTYDAAAWNSVLGSYDISSYVPHLKTPR